MSDISKELPEIDLNSSDIEDKHTDRFFTNITLSKWNGKILTSLERDAKTIIEETGSNMLYLILGLLKWMKLRIQMNISILH